MFEAGATGTTKGTPGLQPSGRHPGARVTTTQADSGVSTAGEAGRGTATLPPAGPRGPSDPAAPSCRQSLSETVWLSRVSLNPHSCGRPLPHTPPAAARAAPRAAWPPTWAAPDRGRTHGSAFLPTAPSSQTQALRDCHPARGKTGSAGGADMPPGTCRLLWTEVT